MYARKHHLYEIVNDDTEKYRESTYRSRAIVRERLRLAMGLSLRPENKPVHLTAGVEASNISEKYYEPPLMQVIPSACESCEENKYEVSNVCKGCLAHPCQEVCPKGAISMVDGRSFIDQDKCIKCGRCKSVCPYDAIAKKERPCQKACGVNAIVSDKYGRAFIDNDKCVSCGMCMVSCPFGAISDKSCCGDRSGICRPVRRQHHSEEYQGSPEGIRLLRGLRSGAGGGHRGDR